MLEGLSMFGGFGKLILSPFIWLLIGGVFIIFAVGFLFIRHKRRLVYPCLIVRQTGNGKTDIQNARAGFFGYNRWLGGLIDYGREKEVLVKAKRSPMLTLYEASLDDMHDINGRKGFICKRKEDDPTILVPLSTLDIQNNNILANIAPADYRDASVHIIRQAERESRSRIEIMMQYAMTGLIAIIFFISLIFIVNMIKSTQADCLKYTQQCSAGASSAKPPVTGAP